MLLINIINIHCNNNSECEIVNATWDSYAFFSNQNNQRNDRNFGKISCFFVRIYFILAKFNMANQLYDTEKVLEFVLADSGDENSDSEDEVVADVQDEFEQEMAMPNVRKNTSAHERTITFSE